MFFFQTPSSFIDDSARRSREEFTFSPVTHTGQRRLSIESLARAANNEETRDASNERIGDIARLVRYARCVLPLSFNLRSADATGLAKIGRQLLFSLLLF